MTSTNSLIVTSGSEVHSASSTVTYEPLAGALAPNGNITTEAIAQTITRLGGTASQLYVEVSVNTNTVAPTVKTRKGSVSQNQTATLTANTTGIFQDTTHTDTITAGDKWNYMVTPGSASNLTITIIQMTYAETTNTLTQLSTGVNFTITAANAYKTTINSLFAAGLTTDTTYRSAVMKAGTFKNIFINVTTASASTTHTITLFDAGVASSLVATATAATTGFFEDTTHTVSVTTGHGYSLAFQPGATFTNLFVGSFGLELETTNGTSLLCAANDVSGGKLFAKGTTNFNPIGGNLLVGTTTESFAQSYVRDTTATLDNLSIEVNSNATSGVTNSVTLDKNGSATALTVTFTTGTGLIQDTTHSVTSFASTDLLSYKIVNAAASGTPTIGIQWIDMALTTTAPPILLTVLVEWEE